MISLHRFQGRFGHALVTSEELERVEQSKELLKSVQEYLEGLNSWQMEGFVFAIGLFYAKTFECVILRRSCKCKV